MNQKNTSTFPSTFPPIDTQVPRSVSMRSYSAWERWPIWAVHFPVNAFPLRRLRSSLHSGGRRWKCCPKSVHALMATLATWETWVEECNRCWYQHHGWLHDGQQLALMLILAGVGAAS